MKYSLAIFDMDGTILNTLIDITNAINYSLEKNGFPKRSIDEVKFMVGNGTYRLVQLAVPENSSKEDVEAVYNTCVPYYQAHSADSTCIYPGIVEMLQTLRAAGCKTAVVSNKPDAAVKKLAEEYFTGLFDVAIGEDERNGRKKKPSPDEVNCALEELELSREEAVYIGDSDVDVATARNSKMDLIAVDWGYRDRSFLEDIGAEVIVSNPNMICDIIL